jgi:hypothetical protein
MDDEYNVNEYTDEQLFHILDLNNPSDRELEAKILSMVRKYATFGNASGDKLSQFFVDIYNRFFENDEPEDNTNKESEKEGFTPSIDPSFKTYNVNSSIVGNGNVYNSGVIGTPMPENITANNIFSADELSRTGNEVKGTLDDVKLTKTVDYSKDQLNPLLKQTIKRIISIDSQYRNQQANSPSTNFTFNLSEPMRDVVSLSLYSIQIPYTWYTVNSDFGGNFFYLKGNVPGINNGLHDYKISIPSGNYTPSGLVTAVNTSIKTVTETYTDVSFGNTQMIYNNGVNDQNSGTGKCTLEVDITKIYNEGNYSLNFPNWSTPTNDTERLKTIAGYLGFNNQQYYCSSIYSTFFSSMLKTTFPITTKKTNFIVVPYTGNSYLTADVSYSPIPVSFDLFGQTQITIQQIVTILNTTLINNQYFDNKFTGCKLIDISNALHEGNGESYIEFSCKLNNNYAPKVRNLKLAAVFPYDVSGTTPTTIFYGTTSHFAFSDSIKDPSGNVVCEFNELLSETPILQSSYKITDNTKLFFKCDVIGYKLPINDLSFNIPTSIYTLNTFINATNKAIKDYSNTNPNLTNNISFYSDTNTSRLNIKTQIDNIYYNKDYNIYASSTKLNQIFGLDTVSSDTKPADISYNIPNYQFTSLTFDTSDIIYIKPISPGNKNATPFSIVLNGIPTSSNGYNLATELTRKIANYQDLNTGLFPFAGSNVVYSVDTKFTLNLSIILNLNQSFYVLDLSANPTIGDFKNIWTDLSFNASYNLKDFSSNNFIIVNKTPIKDNTIRLFDGSNNTFSLIPSNTVDVFSGNNPYSISIKIPDTSTDSGGTEYAINDLLISINNSLSNTIANGTIFEPIQFTTGETFLKIRFNINQVFTTKDYNLVFYDPFSFTSCFSNSSRNTSTSIQNATWDTTLGWLLGYRAQISYNLLDYVSILDIAGSSNQNIYYLKDSSNVCVLIGDTNVSTNLYNYFMIRLDDYVQNHLNDGLVTITNQETSVNHGPFVNVCDPVTGQMISRPADYGSPGITYTAQQLYAFNQQVQSQLVKVKSYSKGPFVQDVFGIIPVKTSGLAIGSVYVEFGGTLQNQQRLYFGPVNIHRMTIQLLNDRGNLVDLNNANWSFSFVCEQLYKSGVS